MIDVKELPAKFVHFRNRWEERNSRMSDLVDAVNGEYDVDDPADEAIENRSPNFIKVALEDTAEASSLVPTIRMDPTDITPEAKDIAVAMERMAGAYFDISQIDILTIKFLYDLVGHGICAGLVYFDPETRSPMIQWRPAQLCYPQPGWKSLDSVREAFFAQDLHLSQLPTEWQAIVNHHWPEAGTSSFHEYFTKKVVLIEYFCEDEWIIAALYQSGVRQLGGQITYNAIELERGENPGGICPVVIGQRITLDNEPRGQFDQLIGMMKAHTRLMGMALDYADQAIFSDVWVKDLIGPLNFGGGAYIQLGPNGSIGRLQPAVTGFSVFQELASLIDGMHLSGRYPKARPGDIDQAIASSKFLETSAGIMNTAVRTYHLIMKRFWAQALRLCFLADKKYGQKRPYSGVLRNQQYMIERDPSEIDLNVRIRVEYGMALGHDPASAMVLGIQAQGAGFVSSEFVQENFEGITDVSRERARIDVERMRDMAMAQLLQGLEQGTVPKAALVEIAKARADGKDLFEMFEKYVVKPAEQQQASMLTSGLTGEQMPPGMPLGGPAGPGMSPPPPEALLGALGIGGAGAPTPGSRLNVPLGDGSFVSSNQGL